MSLAVDAVLRPIRTGNAFEETVERLLHAIKLGVFTAGERLPAERELAGRLGVSRVTLREAIRVLDEAGYVESRRGRAGGTFVTYRAAGAPDPGGPGDARDPGDPGGRADKSERADRPEDIVRGLRQPAADLEDALTLRAVLDLGAAEMAARRGPEIGDGARDHLLGRLADCERAEFAAYRQMDSRLHLAIAEVTGSASLAAAVADARMRVNDLLDQIPVLQPNIEHASAQHRTIVHAILAGDVPGARAAVEEHLDGTAALLRGFLA
jgi:DNA-binding FadR family transcriptional regulator